MTFLTGSFLPAILNMSITGGILILLVLLVRLLLKRAPRIFSYLLWSAVLFRLLCPVSFTSDFSLLRFAEPSVEEATQYTSTVTYVKPEMFQPSQTAPDSSEQDTPDMSLSSGQEIIAAQPAPPESLGAAEVLAIVYLCGFGALLLYSVVSLVRLCRRLVGAVRWKKNICLADGIDSPFVLGLFRPKIYLPSALGGEERDYIVLHEEHHIRRLDHVIKLLAFAALCLHWFNPLVWAAFFLSVRDMEMSCDEAVMKRSGRDIRADYSSSLLSLATGRRIISGTPLAFGEGDPGGRVKNVLRWKRPRRRVVAAAAVLCLLLLAACVANPRQAGPSDGEPSLDLPAADASQSPLSASEALPVETVDPQAAQWRTAQAAAAEKLNGYLWPRETFRKTILGEEVEFTLYHGNGWTIHVPVSWEETRYARWESPSRQACFTVSHSNLGVNNPMWYRAQQGAWRYETDYDPPFDFYYKGTGYTPPAGSVDHDYFFVPAGSSESYEICLETLVGETGEMDRAIQEAILLSFTLDGSSHVLYSDSYTPGVTEWEAAMAGLLAADQPIRFSTVRDGAMIAADGKGDPAYMACALALEEFRPEALTQAAFGARPEEAAELSAGESVTLCLPELGIWLYFYRDSSYVSLYHADEVYWTQVTAADGAAGTVFDAALAWMEAERAWAGRAGAQKTS